MNLFHVMLKLIHTLTLTDQNSYNQLTVDVKEWEATCVEDSPDKMKALYAKIHKGVLIKLLMPFAYFFLLKWVRDIQNPNPDNFLED